MLIVIPTYRRIACLKWTLLSLFQAQQTHQLPSVKLCIVNNHPQSRVLLEQLISEIRGGNSTSSSIEWHVIHREKTLDPVINWYSAIEELAEPDEVVLLHGDDDLFMPWGVFARVQAINASNADMLMTRSAHGLLYLPDSQSCTLRNLDVTRGGELCKVERKDIDGWGPAFIGNHCYKNTPTFRKAVKLSFDWCHDQCWLDQNTRTLMLPYYLPFAIKEVGGNLYGLNETCVLRGGGLEEILTAKYGVSGWNPGFLVWCASSVISKLGPIESASISLNRMASDWFLTFIFDSRIPFSMLVNTIQRIGLPKYVWSPSSILSGIKLIVFDFLRLRRLRDRIFLGKEKRRVEDVLRELNC